MALISFSSPSACCCSLTATINGRKVTSLASPLLYNRLLIQRRSLSSHGSKKFRCYIKAKTTGSNLEEKSKSSESEVDCVGTGLDVECLITPSEGVSKNSELKSRILDTDKVDLLGEIWEWTLLVSPFFFWGTAMVAMKEVLPKTGPFFVSAFRLIPAGMLLVGFAASRGRNFPSGFNAWLSITLFALIDAACFQVSILVLWN